MSPTWRGVDPPPPPPITGFGALRGGAAATALLAMILTGFPLLLALRAVERALLGAPGRCSGYIVQGVGRAALPVLGLRLIRRGRPAAKAGAVAANHTGWLDIFVLHAVQRVVFVSKAEVAGWPGIGVLAKGAGTVFIRRDRRDVAAQSRALAARFAAGQRLLFFPEGTSSDGRRVLPFKPALFGAFFEADAGRAMHVQPITVAYHAPRGADPSHYGWWGDMDLVPHLWQVLAGPRPGRVEVTFHPPLAIGDYPDRKALARAAEAAVRAGLPWGPAVQAEAPGQPGEEAAETR